ncbi:MAG: hypothetical protein L3J14_02970 [Flavobacteriaceae bacterium]|nr:hypothetical protein [Flavobacteriaceae bacterium]
MKKIVLLITFSFLLISCGSTKNSRKSKTNYNTTVDIGKIKFSGGDGLSIENAIVILNAKNSREGIAAEYTYLGKILGEKFVDWTPLGQALTHKDGKSYDIITVQKKSSNEELQYYFDISSFFGKF